MPHLFEFTDQPWLPAAARQTFFEILDLCNSRFRNYNASVADKSIQLAEAHGDTSIVELGAGRAPISRHLAADERTDGWKIVPCDLKPHEEIYRELESSYPEKVSPIYEPVDFSQPRRWESGTLLIFCAALHHVPSHLRPGILKTLADSSASVAVFEPMKRSLLSVISVYGAIVPALLLPILGPRKKLGFLRRAFWCWLFPVVPLMFLWDAVVSCLRQWPDRRWNEELATLLGPSRTYRVSSGRHSQIVTWQAVHAAADRPDNSKSSDDAASSRETIPA